MSPFLRLATPRATYPVTFHVSAVTPVTVAGNTIRRLVVVLVVVVVRRSRKPAGTIHLRAFVQPWNVVSHYGEPGNREGGSDRGRKEENPFSLFFRILAANFSEATGVATPRSREVLSSHAPPQDLGCAHGEEAAAGCSLPPPPRLPPRGSVFRWRVVLFPRRRLDPLPP